jgi:hypothetical protein
MIKGGVMAAKDEEKKDAAGLFIPAGLFLGFAWGFITGNIVAGLFAGLGIGFLLMAFAMNQAKK